jgi:peptidoglycan lytic transglycosylase G
LRFLFTLFLLVLLAAAIGAAWLWYGIAQPYQGFGAEGVFVDVPHGTSSRAVGHLLQSNGVIRSAVAFEIYARRKRSRTVQAGEYFFDHPVSARDVFWKLAKGEVYEQPFTVHEGDSMFDIARELDKAKLMTQEEFLAAASDPSLLRDIAPGAPTLEGFLFPATYHLSRHPVAKELTADMVRKFKEEWASIKAGEVPGEVPGQAPTGQGSADNSANSAAGASTGGPSATPAPAATPTGTPTGTAANASTTAAASDARPLLAVVTLASLVERETPRPEERPLVAGAFTNRLEKGMAMQCDPTVVYAMERAHKYRGALSSKDLKFDSPYNTYEHAGLPPGPIANPGEASLRAALQPAKTTYIFFVANTHGGHFFAGTLAEHNRNVLKYRRLLEGGSVEDPPALAAPNATAAPHRKGATP